MKQTDFMLWGLADNNVIFFPFGQVRVSLFTNKTEVVRLIFSGKGSTKTSWFSLGRLLSSPWKDIFSEPQKINFLSIAGDAGDFVRRTFLINGKYIGCEKDRGWMLLTEKPYCKYESAPVAQYSILYSPGPTNLQFLNAGKSLF